MRPQLVIGPGHLAGVEAQQRSDGSWSFHWVHLHRRKGGVHIARQGVDVHGTAALALAVGARYPVALILGSERVLMREMPGDFEVARDISKLLPNARPEELVIGTCANGAKTQVALVRAQLVTELLKELGSVGLRVVQLFIGPPVLMALRSLAQPDDIGVRLGPFRFDKNLDGSWAIAGATDATGTVSIGDETMDALCLTAFAACWQSWYAPLSMSLSPLPEVAQAVSEERYRVRYERGLVALMALLLMLVAGNGWLRLHLDNRQAGLQDALDRRASMEAELDSLTSSMETRKELIRTAGIGHAGGTMRVLDRLAASVPEHVVLNELWLAPATKPLVEGQPLQRDPGLLYITGRAEDPALLPAWVSRLKTLEGVRNARLKGLEQEPNEGMPVFHIEIDLS